MNIKHKLLIDYQYISLDKKIFVIKSGTIIENYCYKANGEQLPIDKSIILANPQIFSAIDWKIELVNVMKAAKLPQPAVIAKKIIPFLDEMVMSTAAETSSVSSEELEKIESDYKEKTRRLKEREIDYDAKFEKLLRREKDLEVELESKMKNASSVSSQELEKMEEDYRQKVRKLREKEIEIEESNNRLIKKTKELESDVEFRTNRLSKREVELKDQISELESRESEVKKKLRDAQSQEEKVREYEVELKKKERELDNVSLMSEKDMESKQKELHDKIKVQLSDLEIKERDYNDKMNRMEEYERKLTKMQDKVDNGTKNLEDETAKKLEEIERDFRKKESEIMDRELEYITKIRNIKTRLESFEKMIPWVHLPQNVKSDFNSIVDATRQIQ
jgi:chromosome segregation ATPase